MGEFNKKAKLLLKNKRVPIYIEISKEYVIPVRKTKPIKYRECKVCNKRIRCKQGRNEYCGECRNKVTKEREKSYRLFYKLNKSNGKKKA